MASNMCKLSLIVAMILLVTVAAYPSRPSYIRCTSSEDCSPEECCVLGKFYDYFSLKMFI